jgi:hypothetical protein
MGQPSSPRRTRALEFIAERLLLIHSEQVTMRADMSEIKTRMMAVEQHLVALTLDIA